MPGPVERWLGTFMCKQYADTFDAYGFKTLQSVCQLQLPQLQAMGVTHDHCEKVLENVHILRQTLLAGNQKSSRLNQRSRFYSSVNFASSALRSVALNASYLGGSMNHYSDEYGSFDASGGRMAAMGYTARYDEANMGGMVSNSNYPPLAHGYGDQNHMMMHQQHQPQPIAAHSGMYHPSQQYMMQQQQQHQQQQQQQQPNSASQYPSSYGMSSSDVHSQMGGNSFYANAPQQQMPQTTPVHHHIRQAPSVNTSPQQVADNILHMASAYPQQQTVQVPLANKNRHAPYHIPISNYSMQTSPVPHQMGMNMARSPHYSMQPNSPNQSQIETNRHMGYPSSSPHHQQNRTSPVSPMLMHSPISQQSNHSHQSMPSPGSLHSPTSTGTVRSPVPSPGYHQGVGGLKSPSDMQQMAMSQQMRSMAASHMSSPMGSSPHRSCSSGNSSQQQQHYSVIGSPQNQHETPYHPVPKGDIHSSSQSQIYHNPSTSTSPYISDTCSESVQANACVTNPLQSLQKLVMLPETRVVDPKSVVNDACLPSPQSHDGSKNCDSSADRLGEDYSGSAECSDTADRGLCTSGKSPHCLDGKNCSDGEHETDNYNSKTSEKLGNNSSYKPTDNCVEMPISNSLTKDSNLSPSCPVMKGTNNLPNENSDIKPSEKVSVDHCVKGFHSSDSSNISAGNNSNEVKLVNGDVLLDKMDSSLRNSARKHPKTRIKKMAKIMPATLKEPEDKTITKLDTMISADKEKSSVDVMPSDQDKLKENNADDSLCAKIGNSSVSKKSETLEEGSVKKKLCEEGNTNSKPNVGKDNKDFNKTNPKHLSSESGNMERESTCEKAVDHISRSGWGLFLKSTEDFNDFEHELSDNEDSDVPVTKPFSSSMSNTCTTQKIDFSSNTGNTHVEKLSDSKENSDGENSIEIKVEKVLSRSKRLRSNDINEVTAKKIKLSEKSDTVRSLPPKKSPKGRLRKQSSSDSVENKEKEIVKEHLEHVNSKLNSCFVDLSSSLNTKIVKDIVESDIGQTKKLRPKRKNPHRNINNSDDAIEISSDSEKTSSDVWDSSSLKKNDTKNNSVDGIKQEAETEKNFNPKIQQQRKLSVTTNIKAEDVMMEISKESNTKKQQDLEDSDDDEMDKDEKRLDDKDGLFSPKGSHKPREEIKPNINCKKNSSMRKLSPLRFVNPEVILIDNSDNEKESDEKMATDFVFKKEGGKAQENSKSDVEFLNGLEVKFENCVRGFPSVCKSRNVQNAKTQIACKGQILDTKNSIKNRHRSRGKKMRRKKEQKKQSSFYNSFEHLKLKKKIESMNQKKKKDSFGPFVRIEGTKKIPNVVKLFNQTPVVDKDSKSSKNQKTGYVSMPSIQISNIPSDKSVMLWFNRILSEESWLCALCGKQTSHRSLGDLFGPYYLESHLAFIKAEDESKKEANSLSKSNPEQKIEPQRSTRRSRDRRLSSGQEVKSPPASKPVEVWVHEDCVLWADGVFLIGSKIYGLEEAVKVASSTVCSGCKENGAMVGCLHKGCSQKYHFVCAVEKGCLLDEERFSLLCPKHKVLQEKKLKSAASTSKS